MRSPNVPADADLEKIEKYLKQKYKLALKAVENRHTYLLQPETYEELDIYYNPTADLILIEHHFLNQYYQSETIIKALNSRAKSDRDTYHQERQDLLIKLFDFVSHARSSSCASKSSKEIVPSLFASSQAIRASLMSSSSSSALRVLIKASTSSRVSGAMSSISLRISWRSSSSVIVVTSCCICGVILPDAVIISLCFAPLCAFAPLREPHFHRRLTTKKQDSSGKVRKCSLTI